MKGQSGHHGPGNCNPKATEGQHSDDSTPLKDCVADVQALTVRRLCWPAYDQALCCQCACCRGGEVKTDMGETADHPRQPCCQPAVPSLAEGGSVQASTLARDQQVMTASKTHISSFDASSVPDAECFDVQETNQCCLDDRKYKCLWTFTQQGPDKASHPCW